MTPPVEEDVEEVKEAEVTSSPEQRKRGRPRKHPKVEDTGPKRGRGRPRKEENASGAYADMDKMRAKLSSPEGKRSRGRPRKDETTASPGKASPAKKMISQSPTKKSNSPDRVKEQRERE